MHVYYGPCEIYGRPVIAPACLALANIRWMEAETPVFTHINTSVSTRDASQCELGLGSWSEWTIGQWLWASWVSLTAVCWSERCGGVWHAARLSAPGGLADWGCNGLMMGAKASQPPWKPMWCPDVQRIPTKSHTMKALIEREPAI